MAGQLVKHNRERAPDSRVKRWILRISVTLVALLGVAFASAGVLIHSLDQAWLKQRIQAFALANCRVNIDYAAAHVRILSGLVVTDLVVYSPSGVRAFAPELLRAGLLHVRWSLASFVGKNTPTIGLDVEHVKLAVVVDETGRTSFDAIPPNPAPTPATPLSQLPAELFGVVSLLGRVCLSDVTVLLVKTKHQTVIENDTLRGLALVADFTQRTEGQFTVALGKRDAPLSLTFERHRENLGVGKAALRASLGLRIQRSLANLSLDIGVVQQDIVPNLTVRRLARMDAAANFVPSAGRTEVTLSGIELGDGVANGTASLRLPDHGSITIHNAIGDVDAAHLLRLLPAGFTPVRAVHGTLRYRIEDLAFDHPSEPKVLSLDGDVTDAEVTLTNGSLSVGRARIALQARVEGKGFATQGTATVDELRVALGASRLRSDGITVSLDGKRQNNGNLSGQASLRFTSLDVIGQSSFDVRKGRLQVQSNALDFNHTTPFVTRGDIAFEGEAASLKGKSVVAALASALRFKAQAQFSGDRKLALDADLSATRLCVTQSDDKVLLDAPARFRLGLKEFAPNLDHPTNSDGIAHVSLALGALRASLDATKRGATLHYDLTANGEELGSLGALLPVKVTDQIAFEKMAFDLQSKGRVDRLSERAPHLYQQTNLKVTGVNWDTVTARALALKCESNGTFTRHNLRAELRAEGLTINDTLLGDDCLTLSASLDRSESLLLVDVRNEGVSKAAFTASIAFDRPKHAVSYDISGQLSGLTRLEPLLEKVNPFAGFDLSETQLHVTSRGSVVGVVSEVDEHGTIHVEVEPRRTAGGQGNLELTARALRWSEGDRAFKVPSATWTASLNAEGERRTLDSDLNTSGFDLAFGRRWLTFVGFRDQTKVTLTGSIATGTLDVEQQASVKSVTQNFARMYPIGNVTTSLRARRSREGLIRISELSLKNPVGGTALTVRGGIDVGNEQRRMALRTSLQQDLALASTRRDQFVGRGKAELELRVQSPDFRVFRTKARLRLDNAQIHLPNAHVTLDAIDGELPIVSDVIVSPNGVELLHNVQVNPYTWLRFSDQHPLLRRQSFLSIGSVKTPYISIAPFAANIEVDQNLVSISQFELGVRSGRVTGNGLLEWKGKKSKLHADMRASGVQSSHDEPFDGNASLVVDFSDNSIEGRADILRIGSRHLLDLIDVQDPYRLDASMNEIRRALTLGYPERVNIAFKHGFASAGVNFGGLARLMSVGDVHGIPTGPLVERTVRAFKFEEEP